MRSSKSTSWASKSGPSTHANLMPSPILTRQPPHIPVPSTITGLRLTMVWILRGPGDLRAGLHHDRRPDRERLVDVGVRGERLFHAPGHECP